MKGNTVFKPANQAELTLYCVMGEAVCMIQELESALSCAVIIRMHSAATRAEADEALHKQRKQYTLGRAVQLADKEKFFSSSLQNDLNNFYQKRNWLIHDAMFESKEYRSDEIRMNQLFDKVQSIAREAIIIKHAIEMDMLDFSESQGKDMSSVRKAMKEHYGEN